MQLKSFDTEPRDYYDELLDSLAVTMDVLSDPVILKEDLIYFCDLGHICERLEEFKKHFHRIQPCYPIECNDGKDLLTVLANSGVSFNCSNKQNVKSVCDVGKAKGAIFGTAAVQKSHLKFSQQSGVEVMSFKSELELKKLATLPLSSNCRFILQFAWESFEWERKSLADCMKDMLKLVNLAIKKQVNIVGISLGEIPEDAHLGVKEVIQTAVSVMSFMESLDLKMDILDLGNACSLDNSLGEKTANVAFEVNSILDDTVFPRWSSIVVLADVGRFIARSAFSLMVTVTALDRNYDAEEVDNASSCCDECDVRSVDGCVYINESVYGSFSKVLRSPGQPMLQPKLMTYVDDGIFDGYQLKAGEDVVSCDDIKKDEMFCVKGKSGSEVDVVSFGCPLSNKVQIGDKLLFEDMGDFCYVLRTAPGNGQLLPTVRSFIHTDKIEIARRLKCKFFSFKSNTSGFEGRTHCYGTNNHHSRREMPCDQLTQSDIDVIFENIALLEQNHMNAPNVEDPSGDVIRRITASDGASEDLNDIGNMALFEQISYQTPFAFI